MHERLIELWLDSASERSYQPAFLQMLVAEGHRVLHSTRHGPLEFGKDVVSVAPDGVPCAFQLKGNPGGRLNRTQLRDIQEQLQELVGTAVIHPGSPDVRHRSYLVTNGLVEEDVAILIQAMNKDWARRGYGDEALQVISRGQLLDMALRTGTALWPFTVAGLGGLVEMLAHRGDAMLPLPRVHALLSDLFDLGTGCGPTGAAETERRVSSGAVLLSVALRNFVAAGNHFASAAAWILFFAYVTAALEKHRTPASARLSTALAAARDAALDALSDLADEACARLGMVEGDPWADNEFIRARRTLVFACMSALLLRSRSDGICPPGTDVWKQSLPQQLGDRVLWGEAVIPQLLAHCWAIRACGVGNVDGELSSLLTCVIGAQSGAAPTEPLAQPYYGIEDVVRHAHRDLLTERPDAMEDDEAAGTSFAATGLLHLAARAGLKETCVAVWPDYTRLAHRTFEPRERWQYCLYRSAEGSDNQTMHPPHGSWPVLRSQAAECSLPRVPELLARDPVMLLLFVIVVPQRATPDVLRYLDGCFGTP